jgi:tRNA-2-methylthio-N6-dimethylallyladenosine synthase
MERQVPDEMKSERLQVLQALLSSHARSFNEAMHNRVLPVLFDRKGRLPGQAAGRSPYLQPVHVDQAATYIGEIHNVRISRILPNSLHGELVTAAVEAAH